MVDGIRRTSRDDNRTCIDRRQYSRARESRAARASDDATPPSPRITLHRLPLGDQRLCSSLGNAMPDELGRLHEGRIVRRNMHLRDDRGDVTLASMSSQRILERLLNHVPHPPRRCRHQYAERVGGNLTARQLISHQLVANLRPVPVHDAEVPTVERQVDDGSERRTRWRIGRGCATCG